MVLLNPSQFYLISQFKPFQILRKRIFVPFLADRILLHENTEFREPTAPFLGFKFFKNRTNISFPNLIQIFLQLWWCFVWLFPKDTDCANQDQSHLRCYYDYSWNTFHCHNVIKYKLLQNYTFWEETIHANTIMHWGL